jgi:hypothetical protein
MQLIIPFVWDVVDLFSVFRESLLLSSSRNDPVDFLLFERNPGLFSKRRELFSQQTEATLRNNKELMKILSFQI